MCPFVPWPRSSNFISRSKFMGSPGTRISECELNEVTIKSLVSVEDREGESEGEYVRDSV